MPGDCRINLRAPEETLDLIRRAAAERKMSLTMFMLAASEALANSVLNPQKSASQKPKRNVVIKLEDPEEEFVPDFDPATHYWDQDLGAIREHGY